LLDPQKQTHELGKAERAGNKTIHVEGGRRFGKRKTRINVEGWPGHGARGLRVSTTEKDGRHLVAIGYANFKHDQTLGSAVLHVPGKHEPSLLITELEVSEDAVADAKRDAAVGLIACSLEIAAELKSVLGVGDGCLEWRMSASKAKAAEELAPRLERIDPKSKRAKRLRGQVQLRHC
jgi:hypothetical protein